MGSIVVAKLGTWKPLTILLLDITSGDLLSNSSGNFIPMMAIVFAVVSSFNSVGVSVYQEQLFKVRYIDN